MANETFTITHEKSGNATQAEAEVIHYDPAARTRRAAVRAIGGLILGVASIAIPIWHFFGTWALPLVGGVLAFSAYHTKAVVQPLTCTCPHCGKQTRIDGAALDGPMVTMCRLCMENLQLSRAAKE